MITTGSNSQALRPKNPKKTKVKGTKVKKPKVPKATSGRETMLERLIKGK
jgi:hypothetical protein